MGRCTIGMLSSYQNIKQSDWLWHQTPEPFGVWRNIQILKNAPRPDFLLLYQFDFYRKAAKPQRFPWQRSTSCIETVSLTDADRRSLPPSRLISLIREPPLTETLSQLQLNYEAAKSTCGYVSAPDEAAPTPDYMPAIWYHTNSFRELDQMPPPAKPRTCSWITSGINRTENHRKRLAFLHDLQTIAPGQVDIYGRNLPPEAQAMGELSNKWHAMAPYYYNLAIENYAENGWYASEKLWDALLAWCLPIYYGGTAADRLLPPGSFLRLPSLDEKGIAYIQEVIRSPEAWYAAKSAIAEARQVILHKLNLLNWLSDFVDSYPLNDS
ncbi:glycosyltransferase family 10 [Leptolyngbya sp. FACHB-711]|uniref:glycosyltransferase family 10 domain-containing protein n=1 Tax=unclassified Leptolyngbya TaxID=2650499 RepID=UPI0016853CCF|nr:glycosyltransferase family 10 [Leptolyngbya sp. FACHB-711]MBD1850687.1 glycosyltransferase [Cyanobacteria bacterium FACHB-502]MBD2027729.1 glycosyltransferase [Leptolyngbya sp. FACHB-711]